jgi:hypothetical protein
MGRSLLTLAIGAAIGVGSPAAANAAVVVSFADAQALPAGNDFSGALSGLGITRYATSGIDLVLDAPGTILFEFLGSESGFSDSFEGPGISFSETSSLETHFASPIAIGSSIFSTGTLAGLISFASSGGKTATVGEQGFALFLDPIQISEQATTVFYLGFDDQITGRDDDFDDLIIRGTYTGSMPEPGTWVMLLLGFGAMGWILRRRGGSLSATPAG